MRDQAPETYAEKLAQLQELKYEAIHAGSEAAVAKQHAKGQVHRARADRDAARPGLLPSSSTRSPATARPTSTCRRTGPYGDGVVTGHGTIDGRQVCVFARTSPCSAAPSARCSAEKIVKVMDLATKIGCPVIGINDSGGARIQEGVVSLGGYGEIFLRNVQLQRRHPADQPDHGPVRRRRGLLPGDHRLHLHGRRRPRTCSSPAPR